MASLEAMKLPGAGVMLSGEAALGRVLRSHTGTASLPLQPKAKLVDTKITYKAKKKKADTEKPTGKREAVRESTLVEEDTTTVAVVKKPRKTTTKKKSNLVEVSKSESGVVVTTTTKVQSWSVSLSAVGALAEATKHLVAADAKLKQLIESHGDGPVWDQKGDGFAALVRAIVYQQLAGKAASTIHGRLMALCGGSESLTPAIILGLSAEELRAAGISARKASYLHDLAEKFSSGFLSDEKLAIMSEDELVTALTAVKGIGVWSAHMFMIFHLHKSDVLPVGDLGIRRGFRRLFQLKQEPSATEMQDLALSWQPYRSLASWYLWRLSDMKLPDS